MLLSLLTVGMVVSCGGRNTAPSSENIPSSQPQGTTSNNPSSDVSSNPQSKSDSSAAKSSSDTPISSSIMPNTSSDAPISSSEMPSSSATPSSSSEAPSSSSEAPSSSAAPVAVDITLNTDNVKKVYTVGESLNLEGLVVTVNMSDNTSLPVTNYTTNPANGTLLNETGEKEIGVNYLTFNKTFTITVNPRPKQLTGISLDTTNVKKEYFQGENLDLTGLVVTANYDDDSSEAVTNYTSDPANGAELNVIGQKEIVISYNSFQDSFNVNVSKAPKTAWTEEEAAIMSENLHGEVLPFNGLEESVVEFDATTATVTISGGSATFASITAYAELLVNNDFDIVGSSESAIGLEKPVNTSAGKRFVYVYLTTSFGEFYLEANDPYLYEFPSDFAEEVALDYFGSEDIVPAIDADCYEINESYLAIFCTLDADTDDAGYSAILAAENWNVLDETDADGYYVASSPDGAYQVAYLYIDGILRIYIEPLGFWNSALIANFFDKYPGSYAFEVPALEIESAQYQFIENQYNDIYYEYEMYDYLRAQMVIYGCTEDDLTDYVTTLEGEDWVVSGSDLFYSATLVIENEGIAKIEVEFMEDYDAVVITIYWMLDPIPASIWPADEIAEFLGADITDVVPEFEGDNNGFTVLNDSYGFAVMVSVDPDTEEEAVEAYAAVLMREDYSEFAEDYYGDMQYLSLNKQILVTPYFGTQGSITISIKPFNAFPYEETATKLAAIDSTIEDEVIGMDGAEDYYIFTDGTYVQAQCYYASEEDAESAYGMYIDIMDNSEYGYGGLDDKGNRVYQSPNDEFYLTPWIYVDDYYGQYLLVIDINLGVFVPPETGWPFAEIAAIIGETLASELPVYKSDIVYSVNGDSEYADMLISCAVLDKTAAAQEYRDMLLEDEWTENGKDNYGDMHYLSPSGRLDVNPTDGYQGSNMIIEVNVMPSPTWPTAEIAALCAVNGCTQDVIPAFNGGTAYKINTNYTFADAAIEITCANPSTLASAYYELLVEEYGWEDSGKDSWGQQTFTSPNEEIFISFYILTAGLNIEITWLAETPIDPFEQGDWPAADIAELFEEAGYTDPLPVYEGPFTEAEALTLGARIIVDFTLPSGADPDDGRWDYAMLLDEEEFDYQGENDFGDYIFLSPNEEYFVAICLSDTGFYLSIMANEVGPDPSTIFPATELAELFPNVESIPTIAGGEGVTFAFDSMEGYAEVYVTYADGEEAATAAYGAYLDALDEAGYVETDLGWVVGYLSPDGSMFVFVYEDDLADGILAIDYMDASYYM